MAATRNPTTPTLDKFCKKEEYESLDRSETFTPVKKYNGMTPIEIRSHLPEHMNHGYSDLEDSDLELICRLLTEPRKQS